MLTNIPINQIKIGGNRRQLQNTDTLQNSIIHLGLLNPITINQDMTLLAGLHRLKACQEIGWNEIPAYVVNYDSLDAELAEIDENLIRNELNFVERGELLNKRDKILIEKGERAKRGDNKEEQDKIVEKIENEEAKDFNQAQKLVNRETKIETIKENPLPDNKYQLIYADPPWKYEHSVSTSRDIENQYPTMDLKDICDLNVKPILADDCILFLWATSPKLEEAMQVVKAWGFIYKTCMVWVKDKIGMGYYARQQHELLLIATKGSPINNGWINRPIQVNLCKGISYE